MAGLSSPVGDPDFNFAVSLMQYLVVPTFVLDPQGYVIIWNRACERLTGLRAEEVLGTNQHWRGFYDHPRPCLSDLVVQGRVDDIHTLYDAHDDPAGRAFGVHAENWCVMPRLGNRLYLAIDVGPIHNAQGELVAVVETLRDMTSEKLAIDELKRMATSDGLTGLVNRRGFDAILRTELASARREKTPLSLVMVDVDHFKPYNDTYGHPAGDECLRQISAVLSRSAVRPADVVARYGGEEFVLILPTTPPSGAEEVAARVQAHLEQLHLPHTAAPLGQVTLSMGLASLPPGGDLSAVGLLAQADAALYQAKHAGRNRFVVYTPSTNT